MHQYEFEVLQVYNLNSTDFCSWMQEWKQKAVAAYSRTEEKLQSEQEGASTAVGLAKDQVHAAETFVSVFKLAPVCLHKHIIFLLDGVLDSVFRVAACATLICTASSFIVQLQTWV